jgi:hypothetical protein
MFLFSTFPLAYEIKVHVIIWKLVSLRFRYSFCLLPSNGLIFIIKTSNICIQNSINKTMDSKICHFWFTLVCNHPTTQVCFLSFLLACLLALCALHGYLQTYTPFPLTSLVSCLFRCTFGHMFSPSLPTPTCFRHHYLIPPLLLLPMIVACSLCFCHHCLFPHASTIATSSSTSLGCACSTTCMAPLMFACLTFKLAALA